MLRAFRYKRRFVADDGASGGPNDRSGRNGEDYVVDVPQGTRVYAVGEGGDKRVLADLVDVNAVWTAARGGHGGRGNAKFAYSQNRVPILAEAGEATEEVELELELQLLADVAVIGVPNAGKSSFLQACSRARPDIAGYPFTTLEPVLGFVVRRGQEFVVVEIPGLLEGAHAGVGLGDDFLRHMGRTRAVIHLLDGASEDPLRDYCNVREEMALYDAALAQKPEVVALNKLDLPEVQERKAQVLEDLRGIGVDAYCISAATHEGVDAVLDGALKMLSEQSVDAPAGGAANPCPHSQAAA